MLQFATLYTDLFTYVWLYLKKKFLEVEMLPNWSPEFVPIYIPTTYPWKVLISYGIS